MSDYIAEQTTVVRDPNPFKREYDRRLGYEDKITESIMDSIDKVYEEMGDILFVAADEGVRLWELHQGSANKKILREVLEDLPDNIEWFTDTLMPIASLNMYTQEMLDHPEYDEILSKVWNPESILNDIDNGGDIEFVRQYASHRLLAQYIELCYNIDLDLRGEQEMLLTYITNSDTVDKYKMMDSAFWMYEKGLNWDDIKKLLNMMGYNTPTGFYDSYLSYMLGEDFRTDTEWKSVLAEALITRDFDYYDTKEVIAIINQSGMRCGAPTDDELIRIASAVYYYPDIDNFIRENQDNLKDALVDLDYKDLPIDVMAYWYLDKISVY